MSKLNHHLKKELHHKRLSRSVSALAGLTGSISAATGIAAAYAMPTGWSGLLVDLGLDDEPWIIKLAPLIAGAAVALATAAGIIGFYSWFCDRREENQLQDSVQSEANNNNSGG